MPSNQQFVNTNAATCINPQPVSMTECIAYTSVNLSPIPNSIPETFAIIFQMKNGNDIIWKYQGTGAEAARDADKTAVDTAVATTV